MPRSVTITTPIPTLEELSASLGVSKSRVRSLVRIMDKHPGEGNRWRSVKGGSAGMVDRGKSRRNGSRATAPQAGKKSRASAEG